MDRGGIRHAAILIHHARLKCQDQILKEKHFPYQSSTKLPFSPGESLPEHPTTSLHRSTSLLSEDDDDDIGVPSDDKSLSLGSPPSDEELET